MIINFFDRPLKTKLILLVMSMVFFVILCNFFIVSPELKKMYRTAQKDKVENSLSIVVSQASIISEFDKEVNSNILDLLKTIPEISYAAFFGKKNNLVLTYSKQNFRDESIDQSSGHLKPIFSQAYFQVEKQVKLKDKYLGKILVVSDFSLVDSKLNDFIQFQLLLLFILLLACFFLASYMQQIIINPIQKLASFMQLIALKKDYSSRIKVVNNDEVGVMYQNFNLFLDEIENKDLDIQKINSNLEKQIVERTKELELAMNEAVNASQLKSRFIAQVSHELRTPLNSIIGYADLLLLDSNVSEDTKNKIQIINKGGEQLLELITSFLDISLIEAGKTNILLKAVKVTDIVKTICDLFTIRFTKKELDFIVQPDISSNLTILTDKKKLTQILTNILGNAYKYTETGFVKFCVYERDKTIEFVVSDSGIGIPKSKLKKIKEPFEQLNDDSLTTLNDGVGLGLSIATNFAHLIGGRVILESVYGKGTTVKIEIPKKKVQLIPKASEYVEENESDYIENIGKKHKLLIVDDIVENRTLVRAIVQKFNFEVYEASNGLEAIKLYKKIQPDLIFMDIRMPEMNGYEAMRRIRSEDSRGKEIPIIVLTASVFLEKRSQIFKAGATAYLSKPFHINDFISVLKKHFFNNIILEDVSE